MYSNLSNKQLQQLCNTLLEKQLLIQEHPVPEKNKKKFNKSDKCLYSFKQKEGSQPAKKSKKEDPNARNKVDNHSQLLTEVPKVSETNPSLVMKECLKAGEQLIDEVEKEHFDIYNLPEAFLSAPPVQTNLLKFYTAVYCLQHV